MFFNSTKQKQQVSFAVPSVQRQKELMCQMLLQKKYISF